MRGELGRLPRSALRRDRPPAPHRGGRSGRLALADARHDDRPRRPARVRADGPLDGGRGRRSVDDARRAHRALPGLLRHERRGAPARRSRRRRAAAPRGPWSRLQRLQARLLRRQRAMSDFDAIVVGASVAGCTAARLYAQRGARVALVEKRPGPRRLQDRLHALHPAQRDADDREARARGAHRGARRGAQLASICGRRTAAGSARAGTRPTATTSRASCSIRSCAASTAETPGVELLTGYTATELLANGSPRRGGRGSPPRAPRAARAPGRRRRRARLARRAVGRRAGPGAPAQPLLLLGVLARRAAGRRPLADVVHGARLRLHVPQRGRAVPRARRAAPRPPARVPGRPRGRLPAVRRRAARRART